MGLEWVVSALFAAGGAYAAVRVELRYLRRDLEKLETRVEALELPRAPCGLVVK